MKVQRKMVIILTAISIISFILLPISYLGNFKYLSIEMIELMQTISSGIFTGAIVTLITTLILYFNEKNKYMDKVVKYSRVYYQSLQNSIYSYKNVLTSYNDEKFSEGFNNNIDVLHNTIRSTNVYLSGENMIYKEEFIPILKNNKKNKIISENLEKLTILYTNMNKIERNLSIERVIKKDDQISIFYYIKNLREELRDERNMLNMYLSQIDENYKFVIKWPIITKSIDDFISDNNDFIVDRTINERAEELANVANIRKVMSSIKSCINNNPENLEMIRKFGKNMENNKLDNDNTSEKKDNTIKKSK